MAVMRVRIVRGGGIAGVLTETSLDDADLAPSDAQQLRTYGEAADVFNQPERVSGGESTHPDRFSYEVTVSDGDREQRLHRREQDLTTQLRDLIHMVETSPQKKSRVLPRG